MKLPGFTAEASLVKTKGLYASPVTSMGTRLAGRLYVSDVSIDLLGNFEVKDYICCTQCRWSDWECRNNCEAWC